MDRYPGPVRDESLAIEFHNTLYAVRGRAVEGLSDEAGLAAWLEAVTDRLPPAARPPERGRLSEYLDLRTVVRDALQAALARRLPAEAVTNALNGASRRSPRFERLCVEAGHLRVGLGYSTSSATDIALGAIARDAMSLIGTPRRFDLRACGAPGCVLLFLKDHPRRSWCSNACGNRARQARLQARRRGAAS